MRTFLLALLIVGGACASSARALTDQEKDAYLAHQQVFVQCVRNAGK